MNWCWGHFGMQQGEVCRELHSLHLRWHGGHLSEHIFRRLPCRPSFLKLHNSSGSLQSGSLSLSLLFSCCIVFSSFFLVCFWVLFLPDEVLVLDLSLLICGCGDDDDDAETAVSGNRERCVACLSNDQSQRTQGRDPGRKQPVSQFDPSSGFYTLLLCLFFPCKIVVCFSSSFLAASGHSFFFLLVRQLQQKLLLSFFLVVRTSSCLFCKQMSDLLSGVCGVRGASSIAHLQPHLPHFLRGFLAAETTHLSRLSHPLITQTLFGSSSSNNSISFSSYYSSWVLVDRPVPLPPTTTTPFSSAAASSSSICISTKASSSPTSDLEMGNNFHHQGRIPLNGSSVQYPLLMKVAEEYLGSSSSNHLTVGDGVLLDSWMLV